jgi:diguanylate cyclase (GGDEF)-like protein
VLAAACADVGLRHATMEGTTMTPNILLVDDDAIVGELLGGMLASIGEFRYVASPSAAIELTREFTPDVILLDAEMPEMHGFDVCMRLKADVRLADIPVIFVTSHCDPAFEIAGLRAGAADFVPKTTSQAVLAQRVLVQIKARRSAMALHNQAVTDALTGVPNRRQFDALALREWASCSRNSGQLGLLLLDIDHFKAFNDHYGHLQGDTCLRRVATALSGALYRATDFAARYGGEEFAVLLPVTDSEGAAHVAARVVDAIAELGIAHAQSPTAAHVTASIGVACFDASRAHYSAGEPLSTRIDRHSIGLTDLIARADVALYAAKNAGRACYRIATDH